MPGIKELFGQFKNKKIALYGLGSETGRVLREMEGGFHIVGLLDSFRTDGGVMYGKPVLSLSDAIEAGIKLIIVAARPGSCRAIAKKIGDICRGQNIALYDIRGNDLLETNQVKYGFSGIEGVTRAGIAILCSRAEVVSFDLFDTMVMRRIYEPADVIELVHSRLIEKDIHIKDFCQKRLAYEKILSKTCAPSLVDIYSKVIEQGCQDDLPDEVTARSLADIEWQVDCGLLVPRSDVVDLFNHTVQSGKHVYLVSDTYYTKKQLSIILDRCGIHGYTDILASCEFGTSKTQELYDELKKREPGKRILHIGDDYVADIMCAQAKGLDTCRLHSGIDLMDCVGSLGLEKHIRCLSDRIRAGMFVADIFNSPFQFDTTKKRIVVPDSYDIGYLFCAPLCMDFVCWLDRKLKGQGICNIWFGARDGYLIQRIYSRLLKEQGREDGSVYFLTSRAASIRAGVKDEMDIRYVNGMIYQGTLEENLKERFGIEAEKAAMEDAPGKEDGLLRYKELILRRAVVERENYQRYIEKLDIRPGCIAFFDFVAKGTTQMYIQRLVSQHMKGFYFLQLEPGNEECMDLDIESYYTTEEGVSSAIFDDYYILETLLTAPHPSVNAFNEMGEPVYAYETRTSNDIACFEKAQKGILDYMDTYMKLCPAGERRENRMLDDALLGLIHKLEIRDEDFMDLVVEDPFFNRMTNITDVL